LLLDSETATLKEQSAFYLESNAAPEQIEFWMESTFE
jgi:hypothetical protein